MAIVHQSTIARALGLSQATVSRALRGDQRIRAETRESVMEAARRLGYRPDPLCAALARHSHRNDAFGERPTLVVATVAADGFGRGRAVEFTELHHLRAVALDRGFSVETVSLGAGRSEQQRGLDRLRRRAVRGIFLYTAQATSDRVEADLEDFEVVNLYPEHADPRFPRLEFDHFEEMERVLGQLVCRGYQRPGLWLGPMHDQVRGWNPWRAAFALLGPERFGQVRMGGGALSDLVAWILEDAIDCLVTFGTPAQCAEWSAAGFQPPPGLGLCGLDVGAPGLAGGLTGIHQPRARIVEHAVWLMETLLHQRLSGRRQPPANILLSGEWVEAGTLRQPLPVGGPQAGPVIGGPGGSRP